MSHSISLLRALSTNSQPFSLDNWSSSSDKEFSKIEIAPGVLPGNELKMLIVSAQGWGGMAQLDTLTDGTRRISAVQGYTELLSSMQADQKDSCLISMLNGSEHSALSLVQHTSPYDFNFPGYESLPMLPNVQPVSFDSIKMQLEPWMNKTIASLGIARMMLPGIRLVHVFPPPPIASNKLIMSAPELFKEHLLAHGIAPLSLRVKWYLLANQIVRNTLNELGLRVEFLEAPSQAVSTDLGLMDTYAAGATHGNEQYGQLVASQLRNLLLS